MKHSSLAELYRNSPYGAFQQEDRTGGSFPVRFVKADQNAHDFVDPPVPELVLVLSLKSNMPFQWDLGEGFTPVQLMKTGQMNLCPPETSIRYECGGDHSILSVCMPVAPLDLLLERERYYDGVGVFGPLYSKAVWRDESVRTLALRMWAESARVDGACDLMADGLFQTLIAELLRRLGLPRDEQPYALPDDVLTRIEEFISAHLDQRFNAGDLLRSRNSPLSSSIGTSRRPPARRHTSMSCRVASPGLKSCWPLARFRWLRSPMPAGSLLRAT